MGNPKSPNYGFTISPSSSSACSQSGQDRLFAWQWRDSHPQECRRLKLIDGNLSSTTTTYFRGGTSHSTQTPARVRRPSGSRQALPHHIVPGLRETISFRQGRKHHADGGAVDTNYCDARRTYRRRDRRGIDRSCPGIPLHCPRPICRKPCR